jgi:ABC-2 type transport system permease protein
MVSGTAMALLFSAANVFFRDVSNVGQIMTNFIRFGVPMIYPYTMVQDRFGEFAQYYLLNPVADAVLLFQQAFWVGTTSDPTATAAKHLPANLWAFSGIAVLVSVILLGIGQLVFSRLENKIPERL